MLDMLKITRDKIANVSRESKGYLNDLSNESTSFNIGIKPLFALILSLSFFANIICSAITLNVSSYSFINLLLTF